MKGNPVSIVGTDKQLGVQERYTKQRDNTVMDERCQKCLGVSQRIQRLPLRLAQRLPRSGNSTNSLEPLSHPSSTSQMKRASGL